MLLRRLAAVLLLALAVPPLTAQAQSQRSILILDASGSMWGQIKGEAKITIAQRVIGALLDTLPEDLELGLSMYGHRRKGDCGDIELMVPPGPNNHEAIRSAISGINPKGKTPISAAVLNAAEMLKYEEDAATVILVSDGRETCERDPCEVGTLLEDAGVDFTAHVIGFDVEEAEDRAQLQCLAENTGGRFLTAANADELGQALAEVSAGPAEPERFDILFRAVDGEDGPPIRAGLRWTLLDLASGETLLSDFDVADLRIALAPGNYRAEAVRDGSGDVASATVAVTAEGPQEVVLVFASALPDATVSGPVQASAASEIVVQWTGPDYEGDFISVAAVGSTDGTQISFVYTREGSPASLLMPADAGAYEIRYIMAQGRKVLARQNIEITEISAALDAPAQAAAGSTIEVAWTGPNRPGDFIAVTGPDDQGSGGANYAYTRDGSPVRLALPPDVGSYEIRYVLNQGRRILARRPIETTAIGATLTAPDSALAGATIGIEWTGPDYPQDRIAVFQVDDRGERRINYAYTNKGSPVPLQLPSDPGEYELRYIQYQGRRALARRLIQIKDVTATLNAPDAGVAGATIAVQWTGPDYALDRIAVFQVDDGGERRTGFTYTTNGSPVSLLLPPKPGVYEIRYVMDLGRRNLASRPIEISDVTAALTVPEGAKVGATLDVNWTGPDYARDYIAIYEMGAAGERRLGRVFTSRGNPAPLAMPADAGDYELRYIMDHGNRILARVPITVQ